MMTVPEAAARAGRNPETIRRWIRSGRLRARKVGTQHVVEAEDLEAVLDADPVRLPDGWDRLVDGTPRPDWGALVRVGRRAR